MNGVDISKVYLLSVPLENDYKNTLYFTDKASQNSYFMSKKIKEATNFTYLRKEHEIHVPYHYDTIYNCNYLMYQNSKYSNKWFYCFIKSMKYENDECTILEVETDVMQTWMFDYTVKPSFVEREHVSDDTIGLHTIPEQLETGGYVRQAINNNSGEDSLSDFYYLSSTYIVVALSEMPSSIVVLPSGTRQYNGVYSGLYYVVFKNPTDLDKFIVDIQDDITEDIIYSIFVIPGRMCEIAEDDWLTPEGKGYSLAWFPFTTKEVTIGSGGFGKPEFLDKDYVPRNKKLLTYPYTYLLVNNYSGSVKEYKYELFETDYCGFEIKGVVCPGCGIKLFPTAYNIKNPLASTEDTINYLEGLDGYKLPTCGWFNDSYTNWLTQNAVNIPLGFIGSGATLVGGLATGNVAVAVGGLSGITSQMAQIYEQSLAPITAKGGVNQGDLNFAFKNTFGVYKMSVHKEYAEIIDKYFDMFGYKVNMVKIPNKAHRSRYWYTKTIDINIDGSIPQDDLQQIKNAYNNGITFWRNASEIQNYDLSNNIV